MKQLSHSETSERRLATIIGRMLMTVDGLNIDIANEEELTGIEDMADPEYSVVARTLRARRDNLTATVELLSRRMLASSQS
jgi:hypothetical protein